MATSDTLLRLVEDLQRDVAATGGRRKLLEYIRITSGARLALLFTFDPERQILTLLERRGYRVQQAYRAAFAAGTTAATAIDAKGERFNAAKIPAKGLFASALDHAGLLYIARADLDQRSLREEQFWIGPHGSVLLSRVTQQGKAAGVLVLCYSQGDDANLEQEQEIEVPRLAPADESNVLICISILSAYVSTTEHRLQPTALIQSQGHVAQQADVGAAIEQERERIARDLHDGAAQQIAHAVHKLTLIARILERQPAAARRELNSAVSLLQESLDELRRSIMSPLPLRLEKQGLAAALQALVEEYRDETGKTALNIALRFDDVSLIPPALETTIYRFVQEALSNVRKHAQAARAVVRIRLLKGLLIVEVSDDGQGFELAENKKRTGTGAGKYSSQDSDPSRHMGLRVMRERVKRSGGTMEITSKRGNGTIVKARFPLAITSSAAVLTRRERDVLRLVVEGLSNRAIAERLSVSPETVKSHMHSIMQKMQVHDRTQVAVAATRQRWV
jgi:signal transduction histidine kinase/DNA-binding CsgD family transcriptional regulator